MFQDGLGILKVTHKLYILFSEIYQLQSIQEGTTAEDIKKKIQVSSYVFK